MAAILDLDRPRRLKFGVTAARDYKRQVGRGLVADIMEVVRAAPASGALLLDLDNVSNLLWAALRADDRALTLDKAASLLEDFLEKKGGSLRLVYDALGTAFAESAETWGLAEDTDTGKATASPQTS